MTRVLFESERDFQLWRARVNHSQLLLRSTRDDSHPTRIDVLFKPVLAMKLRTRLDGLRVREAEGEEAEAIMREVGIDSDWEPRCFVVESGVFRGYVVADAVTTAEDDGGYADPSQLLVE